MNKLILITLYLFATSYLFADLPADRPEVVTDDTSPKSLIYIQGVERLPKDWSLFMLSTYFGTPKPISKNTIIELYKGNGNSDVLIIWAKNNKTLKETPEINYFSSAEASILNILTIRNDSLIVVDRNIETKSIVKDKVNIEGGIEPKIILIIIATIAIAFLVWVYYREKRK